MKNLYRQKSLIDKGSVFDLVPIIEFVFLAPKEKDNHG